MTKSDHMLLCHGVMPRGVRPGSFIPLAAATARITTQEELLDPRSLEQLYISRGRLQRTLHSSFPVEEQVKAATSRALRLVADHISRLEHTPEFDLPTLDPSFLSWKLPSGYPGVAVYGLNDPVCQITYQHRRGATLTTSPELPEIMSKYYLDDVLRTNLMQECAEQRLASLALTARYAGAMPADVRDRVHFYSDPGTDAPHFDAMFIITEAPVWSRQGVRDIPVGDPLVVGVKHGLLWLVATYDLTPVEELVCSLCTSRPDKANN